MHHNTIVTTRWTTSPWPDHFTTGNVYLLTPVTIFSTSQPPVQRQPHCPLYPWVLFCFVFFLDCVYKLDCMAFVFLWLISQHNTFKVFPCCCKWQDFFFFNGGVYTICVVCVCICPYTCPHTHAHTYPHYIFFILSSFSGPLGFFHILVLVNAAVLSIGVLGVFIFFQ